MVVDGPTMQALRLGWEGLVARASCEGAVHPPHDLPRRSRMRVVKRRSRAPSPAETDPRKGQEKLFAYIQHPKVTLFETRQLTCRQVPTPPARAGRGCCRPEVIWVPRSPLCICSSPGNGPRETAQLQGRRQELCFGGPELWFRLKRLLSCSALRSRMGA